MVRPLRRVQPSSTDIPVGGSSEEASGDCRIPTCAGESQRSVLSAGSSADLMAKAQGRVWFSQVSPSFTCSRTHTHTHNFQKCKKCLSKSSGFPQASVRTHTHTHKPQQKWRLHARFTSRALGPCLAHKT